jgi:thiamine pyrophosphokinase
MKKCLIISGGKINPNDLLNYLKIQDKDLYIIGVDGGCQLLYDHHIIPHQILGDFDTLDQKVKEFYMKKDIFINVLDPVKDVTDTHAAFEEAQKIGAKEIDVFGFFGTRLDHSLGALMTAFKYSKCINIRFFDEHNIVHIIDGYRQLVLEKKSNELQRVYKYISIIPIEETGIIQTKNLKYPLKSATLSPYDSYGVSNEMINAQASIDVKDGKLFIIQSND